MSHQRLNDLAFVRYNLHLQTRNLEGISHESIDLDDIDPFGESAVDDQNNDDVLLIDEDLAELERGAAKEVETTELDAIEGSKDTLEETIHHHFDIVEPLVRGLKNCYIMRGKGKM